MKTALWYLNESSEFDIHTRRHHTRVHSYIEPLNLIQQSDLVSSELFYYLAPALKQRICLVKIKYNNNKTYETMCSKIAHVLVSMKQSIK